MSTFNSRPRVTKELLQAALSAINGTFGYEKYRIDGAYGGVAMEETKGARQVNPGGHVSKRELLKFMDAFLTGALAFSSNDFEAHHE